jgi:hypothetical protein
VEPAGNRTAGGPGAIAPPAVPRVFAHADHYFEIGREHVVCEDYALSGRIDSIAYAAVADGCSSSVDVDVGARALLFAVRDCVLDDFRGRGWYWLGRNIVRKAQSALSHFLTLHPQTLDATVLLAATQGHSALAFMWGDGVIVHRKQDVTRVWHLQYPSGAPFYLSYHLDSERLRQYRTMADTTKVLTEHCLFPDGSRHKASSRVLAAEEQVGFDMEIAHGDVLAVLSDGINQYRRADGSSIPYLDLVDDFTKFKQTKGLFAQRRLKSFARQCRQQEILHDDDVSMAAIVVEDGSCG